MLAQTGIKVNFRLCCRWGGREKHFSDYKSEREKASSDFLALVRRDLQDVVDLSLIFFSFFYGISTECDTWLFCLPLFFALCTRRGPQVNVNFFICMFNEKWSEKALQIILCRRGVNVERVKKEDLKEIISRVMTG